MKRALAIVFLCAFSAYAVDILLGNRSERTYIGTGTQRVASWGTTIVYAPESDFTFDNDGTAATLRTYIGAGGQVNIPPTLGGKPVGYIGDFSFSPEFAGNTTVTGVLFPCCLTYIGGFSFYLNTALRAPVYIPASVTTIGGAAFYGNPLLTRIYMEGNAPSLSANTFAASGPITVYRRVDATGYPDVPETFGGAATAIWTSYPNPMP